MAGRAAHAARPAYRACPAVDGADLLTTVTVTDDGYCFEWCTALCATTPLLSS